MSPRAPKLKIVTFRLDAEDKAKLEGLVESHRRQAASAGLGSETTATSVLRSLIRSAHAAAPLAPKGRGAARV